MAETKAPEPKTDPVLDAINKLSKRVEQIATALSIPK
jgi:hypothetical protein